MDDVRRQEVTKALEIIRPYVRGDGGDIELVDISREGVVTVRLIGNCIGCGSASVTVNEGIQGVLQSQLPWVRGVVQADEGTSASLSTHATASFEAEHSHCETLLGDLEAAVLTLAPGGEAPPELERWIAYSHNALRRHFDMEEQCVFPAAEFLLGQGAAPIAALRRDHERYWVLLAATEGALMRYRERQSAADLGTLGSAVRDMVRHLAAHFLREQGGLYTIIDQGMPEDLKREVRADIERMRSRSIAAYQH